MRQRSFFDYRVWVVLAGLLSVAPLSATELCAIKVSGDSSADVLFVSQNGDMALPALQIDDNTVDLVFSGQKLCEALQGKIDLNAPHTLIQRISAFSYDNNVRAKIVVNGSVEGLRQRLQLRRDPQGVRLTVAFPAGSQATLKLLKDEQAPLQTEASAATVSAVGKPGWGRLLIALVVFVLAGVGTYFAARFVKQKSSWRGSRKYLVESLAYCPIGEGGAKAGVSLVKVGSEFVLVGVTSHQVSFLSSLPKLQEQYEQENRFERDTFRDAVEEEVHRLKAKGEITV
jgi:flagellar biogenesis protein FliO